MLHDVRSASLTASVRPGAGATPVHGVARMTLSIRTFGSLEVSLDGELLELPASRRTRALLAFLALSGGLHRRERLCEIFWDTPRDPRSSLRWSLSKLRSVLNAGGCTRLLADRARVQMISEAIAVDFHELRACANDDGASAAVLARAWELSNQQLLEDCELPEHPDFMAWLQYQRNERARLRTRLSRRLALLPDLPGEDVEMWARRWLHEAPGDASAAQLILTAQRRSGSERPVPAPTTAPERLFRKAEPAPQDCIKSPPGIDCSPSPAATDDTVTAASQQIVRYVQADDGTALAWASVGAASNPPLVKTANWMTHLKFDWDAPVWSPLFRDLARTFRFIRYDERGCGLSAWDVPEISFEASVSDLERVVDAAGLERFPLLGISQGACVAIEYAARHPDRVSHLILAGGYAAGWRHTATPEERREREAIMVLTQAARDNAFYRHLLSMTLMPDASSEERGWFDRFQTCTTSSQNAARFLDQFSRVDVRHRLPDVKAPTLVLHSRGDVVIPVAAGRELAKRIANAELVGLDSNNHLLLGREPAALDFLEAIRHFIAGS